MARIYTGFQSYNPYYEPPPRRFGTTPTEIFHITAAMLVLATCLWLSFHFRGGPLGELAVLTNEGVLIATALAISFFGFVLHELGHKFTAQHFGHWSEFRASWLWLGIGLLAAWNWGIIAAAPGATWHHAYDRREQGKISAMGPLVNIAIAVIAFPFSTDRIVTDPLIQGFAHTMVFFSSFLAAFNLIPFGPLDGRKIIQWNWPVWLVMVAIAVLGFIYSMARP